MSRWARSRPLLWLALALALVVVAIGLALLSYPVGAWRRTRARNAWLTASEAEVRQQLQAGRPNPTRPGADNWYADTFALFDKGWAAWRLHSFHWDPAEGGDWTGVGDLVLLIDDQERVRYSRLHFCDGHLGWALSYPDRPLPAQPANLDEFLGLFPPGTWTEDREEVAAAIPRGSRKR